MKFELPKLNFETDALEPFMDKETVEIHHGKHHQAYTDNFNKALEDSNVVDESLEEDLFPHISKYSMAIRNHGGGYWNHKFFWENLAEADSTNPGEKAMELINETFGDFDTFKAEFTKAAVGVFGSGWAWLCVNPDGQLKIVQTLNQENPLMDVVSEDAGHCKPLLVIDVWEHAYYLKYQNRRAEFIEAFFQIINWDTVEDRIG